MRGFYDIGMTICVYLYRIYVGSHMDAIVSSAGVDIKVPACLDKRKAHRPMSFIYSLANFEYSALLNKACYYQNG